MSSLNTKLQEIYSIFLSNTPKYGLPNRALREVIGKFHNELKRRDPSKAGDLDSIFGMFEEIEYNIFNVTKNGKTRKAPRIFTEEKVRKFINDYSSLISHMFPDMTLVLSLVHGAFISFETELLMANAPVAPTSANRAPVAAALAAAGSGSVSYASPVDELMAHSRAAVELHRTGKVPGAIYRELLELFAARSKQGFKNLLWDYYFNLNFELTKPSAHTKPVVSTVLGTMKLVLDAFLKHPDGDVEYKKGLIKTFSENIDKLYTLAGLGVFDYYKASLILSQTLRGKSELEKRSAALKYAGGRRRYTRRRRTRV
jgi:hypothetical protein